MPPLLYIHVPKVAGTALRSLLGAAIPEDRRAYVYNEPPGIPEASLREVEGLDRLMLIYGHFHHGLHDLLGLPPRYAITLREPVDRVVSLYYDFRRRPGTEEHAQIMEGGLSLEAWALGGYSRQTDNGSVRILSGAGPDRPLGLLPFGAIDARHLHIALANLERLEVLLLHDRMDDGLARFGETLGVDLPTLPLVNVTPERPRAAEVPDHARAAIASLNRYDLVLYDRALRMFGE